MTKLVPLSYIEPLWSVDIKTKTQRIKKKKPSTIQSRRFFKKRSKSTNTTNTEDVCISPKFAWDNTSLTYHPLPKYVILDQCDKNIANVTRVMENVKLYDSVSVIWDEYLQLFERTSEIITVGMTHVYNTDVYIRPGVSLGDCYGVKLVEVNCLFQHAMEAWCKTRKEPSETVNRKRTNKTDNEALFLVVGLNETLYRGGTRRYVRAFTDMDKAIRWSKLSDRCKHGRCKIVRVVGTDIDRGDADHDENNGMFLRSIKIKEHELVYDPREDMDFYRKR